MSERIEPKLAKWPFFLGDALLLAAAGYLCSQVSRPMQPWEIGAISLCLAAGAFLGAWPFVVEYRGLVKILEAGTLSAVFSKIENLEAISSQIATATGNWQNVQGEAEKTVAAAKALADRMSAEAEGFSEFMQRINDNEKATLRLEVEKMRRAEAEWLQVAVRMLDHVYALHVGAVRSGQPGLIEQLSHFQNACRDAARRVGLVPFAPAPEEPFDRQRHQVFEAKGEVPEGALVGEVIASGYTFQGRLVRPALVRLGNGTAATPSSIPAGDQGQAQNELPLNQEPGAAS